MKVAAFVFILLISISANAQEKFRMSLASGNHKVGFKQKVYFDQGRPPLKEQRREFQTGRAVHLGVWYPASVKTGMKPMNFSEYMDHFNSMINPDVPTSASKQSGLKMINYFLSQIGGDSILFNKNLPELTKSQTGAYLNADYKPGSYPVIFYPEASYLSSLLGEYLASNGYIVVAVSRFGMLDAEFEWQNVRGIETLVQDCQFALATIKQEFKLTDPNVAAMGVGMNASAGLAWMMRDPRVDALVSLEGGILTGYEYGLIQHSPFYSVRSTDRPMMVFYSPHESVDPKFIDNYKYADRYMAFLPGMKEFYYLNYGIWESSMPNILGKAPGDTKKGFEVVARYTLQFLDATLKGSASAKQFLANTPAQNGIANDLMTVSRKPALPVPPSKAALDKIYESGGFEELTKEVSKYMKEEKRAFSFETMSAFGTMFIQSGSFENGSRWATLFQEAYPEAVTAYTIGGRCNLELGRKEIALSLYQKALQYLPTDESFDDNGREQMKKAIDQRIEQLSK